MSSASNFDSTFLVGGGGITGALIRRYPWHTTTLGPPHQWPTALRTAVNLLLTSTGAVYVCWGDELLSFYNDAYLPIVGDKHPGIGLPFRHLWAEIWDEFQPIVERTMAGQAQHFIDRPIALAGRPDREVGYFTFSYTPLHDDTGVVRGFYVSATETTDRVMAERARLAEGDRLRRMLEHAPGFVFTTRGPDHVLDFVNAAHRNLFDSAGWLGRPVRAFFPNAEEQGFVARLDRAFLSGESYRPGPVVVKLPPSPGENPEERTLDFVYEPLRNSEGQVVGVFCQGLDVTQTARAQARLVDSETRLRRALEAANMFVWEVDHRTDVVRWGEGAVRVLGVTEIDLPDGPGNGTFFVAPDEKDRLAREFADTIAARLPYHATEFAGIDGRIWRAESSILYDDDGKPDKVYGLTRDVTTARLMEKDLRNQSDRLRAALDASGTGTFRWDVGSGVMEWDEALDGLFGIRDDAAPPTLATFLSAVNEEDRTRVTTALKGCGQDGAHLEDTFRMTTSDGSTRWLFCRARAFPSQDGNHRTVTGACIDITERKAAEGRLEDAQRKLDAVLSNASVAVFLMDERQHCAYMNAAAERLTGYSFAETQGRPLHDVVHHHYPDGRPFPIEECAIDRAFPEDANMRGEEMFVHKDGSFYPVAFVASPIRDSASRTIGTIIEVRDISEEVAARRALAESELKYRAVFEQAGVGVARVALEGHFLDINNRYCEILGRSRDELVGEGWKDITHPDDLAADVANVERLLAGEATHFQMEKRYVGRTGADIWVNLTVALVRDDAGAPAFFVAVAEDIGARRRAEEALQASEARLRAVVGAAPVGLVFADAQGRITGGNARVEEIVGHPVLPSANVDAYDEWIGFHADGRRVEAREYPLAQVVTGEAERAELEVLYRRGDGRDAWIRFVASTVRDSSGARMGGVVASLDIDRERRLSNQLAQEVEKAVAERETALAQLHEAQKLETLGQLTGGVAHDFNNLLTPIMGVLELMERRVVDDERTRKLVAGALQSAERARNLVQRLLAFARRQHLETRAVAIGLLIEGMRDLINHSVGPTVAVQFAIEPGLPPVLADPGQLELALLNLAINARDAMPDGGMLTIQANTARADPTSQRGLSEGRYVVLSVRDTGFGMDAETLKRCIEPFFTSKGVGQGTGLGLSMVHGMVGQLGGAFDISSAPGEGTTVALWLPVTDDRPEPLRQSLKPLPSAGGTAPRALLVEDEPAVRAATTDLLLRLGYNVLEADCGEAALRLLADGSPIDVLITDYLMPGMTGRELARKVRASQPELPVLIMTGYSRLDEIGSDFARIEKPYLQIEFAERLAEVMVKSRR